MPDPIQDIPDVSAGLSSEPVSSPSPISSEPVSSPSSTPSSYAPAASSEPSAPAAPQEPDWREHLSKQWGLDPQGFQSPNQAIDYSLQALVTMQQEREAYQARLAQYEQQLAAFSQPAAPVQAQPAPQQPEPLWNPPEYDPTWNRFLQMNPTTGLYEPVSKDVVNPEIVRKANERAAWERKWQTEFANNPFEFIKKGMQDEFKKAKEEAYQQAVEYFQQFQSQQTLQQSVQSTVQNHSEWLYQKDALGNVGLDAQGRPLLTEKGKSYAQAVETLARSGVSDPKVQDQLALQLIGHTGQAAQPANRLAQYAGTPAARNLAEALHTSNRSGSNQPVVAGAVGPATTPGSFLAMAAESMREQGLNLSSGNVTPV
jgi:hypothetical protein